VRRYTWLSQAIKTIGYYAQVHGSFKGEITKDNHWKTWRVVFGEVSDKSREVRR